MAKRECGWAVVGNEVAARAAFQKWNDNVYALDARELVLARDFAIMQQMAATTVEGINRDLRELTSRIIRGGK